MSSDKIQCPCCDSFNFLIETKCCETTWKTVFKETCNQFSSRWATVVRKFNNLILNKTTVNWRNNVENQEFCLKMTSSLHQATCWLETLKLASIIWENLGEVKKSNGSGRVRNLELWFDNQSSVSVLYYLWIW